MCHAYLAVVQAGSDTLCATIIYHIPEDALYRPQEYQPDYDNYPLACNILAKLPNLKELIIHLHPTAQFIAFQGPWT